MSPADTAADGREGLAAGRQGDFAIIFADVHMQDLDGVELTACVCIEVAETRLVASEIENVPAA